MEESNNRTEESSKDSPRPDTAADAPAPAKPVRPPSPHNCRNFIRKKTAAAMPEIVEAFVQEAKGGSVSHFTSLAKVGGFDKAPAAAPQPKRRGKSLARRLLDEVERFEAKHGIQPGQSSPDTGNRTPEERI
jgi:hypothetical protein